MKRGWRGLVHGLAVMIVALAALVSSVSSVSSAWASDDPKAFEARITAELEAKNPEAAALFRKANEARERGDMASARDLYGQVREKEPGFVHATRRLCSVEVALGRVDEGIAYCREALAADDSIENRAALASALTFGNDPTRVSEAARVIEIALSRAPRDPTALGVSCEIAIAQNNLPDLRHCVRVLGEVAPDALEAHTFSILVALSDGDYDKAHEELERAHALGLGEPAYRNFSKIIDDNTPLTARLWPMGLRVGLGWLSGFAVLLCVGFFLSHAALRASRRVPTERHGHAQGTDRHLRRLYRTVLWLSCAYYYVSIPIVLFGVLALGGGLIYAFFALGHIPIKLVLIIAVVVFVTVGAVIKSIFVRGKDEDPGLRLETSDHPKLTQVLSEVAGKVGTRPVDTVYMTPGTEIAVMERGGMLGQMRGQAERCLILGAGVLKGMKVLELKSILAHEYGHFQNEDTAGGGFALAVRRSLLSMAIHLARGGVATWYNPAWWFVNGFHRVFLIISQGASRLQEVLADRWAAHAYGSETFERGLLHVIERSARFDAHIAATLNEVVENKQPLLNLYTYKPAKTESVESAIEEALNAKPSAYDSHPAPADRLSWVRALAAPRPEEAEDDEKPAWSLFSGRKKLEQQMTDEIRDRLVIHGVVISKPGDKPDEDDEAA